MKQIKFISAMLLIATMFLGFNACSSDDNYEKENNSYKKLIIGTWKLIVADNEIEKLVFDSNGMMVWWNDGSVADYARYIIKGNKLYLRWSDKDVIENENQEWWNDTNYKSDEWEDVPILELNSTNLILDWGSGDGSDGTYKRIK